MSRVVTLMVVSSSCRRASGLYAGLGDRAEAERTGLPRKLLIDTLGEADARRLRILRAIERDYIAAILRANDGNRTRTARELGIGAATLYRKIKEYGLPSARE